MLNKKTSRRALLKSSAQIAGLAATVPVVGWTLGEQLEATPETAQKQFIEAVLKKHASKSQTATLEEIREFAERFTEVNGVVNYKGMFSTISGEYRLARLFVRSVRHGVKA